MKKRKECTGCAACVFVCPKNAIQMKADNEGFLYPQIDENRCVRCGLCEKVCSADDGLNSIQKVALYQSSKKSVLKESTSGGAVELLARKIIDAGGVVFGVAYDLRSGARWKAIDEKEDLSLIHGSKYFQVVMSEEAFHTLISYLEQNRRVLVIGTPCQVAAIKRSVPAAYMDSLFTVDLICGGVASPKLEKLYIEYLEKQKKKRVVNHLFRAKNSMWDGTYYTVIEYEDGSKEQFCGTNGLYTRAYASNRFMRESCYQCPYTMRKRAGDITVGDAWGEQKIKHSIKEKHLGISLVLINNEKGELLVGSEMTEVLSGDNRETILRSNKPLNSCGRRWVSRSFAYSMYRYLPFSLTTNIICYRYWLKKIMHRR